MFARLIRSTDVPAELVVHSGGTGKPSHRLDYHQRLRDRGMRWACAPQDGGATDAGDDRAGAV